MLARVSSIQDVATPSIKKTLRKAPIQKPYTRILMSKPSYFSLHEHAPTYHSTKEDRLDIQRKAFQEHAALYDTLIKHSFDVVCLNPTSSPSLPMYIYRYVSVHHPVETKATNSYGLIYSLAPPEQKETLYEDVLMYIQELYPDFMYYDLRTDPSWAHIEGGSLVIDKEHKTIYAIISPKSYFWKLLDIKRELGYTLFPMNVMNTSTFFHYTSSCMAFGSTWVIFCSEIVHEIQRKKILENLQKDKKCIIEIDTYQASQFCTNVIEMKNKEGKVYTIMSSRAHAAFHPDQLSLFENILVVPFDTIETYGKEGIRSCMVEI